tara:strand:+ start:198 stop:839 length:642 start_codon:yes stop_codon:yes gene_type:complete
MKLNSILKLSSIFVLFIAVLSSCNSSIQIVKKRHSNGYYVSVGSDIHTNTNSTVLAPAPKAEKEIELLDAAPVNESIESEEISTTEKIVVASNETSNKPSTETKTQSQNVSGKAKTKKESKFSKFKKIKALKKELKKSENNDIDTNTLLLLILAILLPPLAVYLMKGISNDFWLNLILAILGWGILGIVAASSIWFGGIVAIVHALLLLFGII